MASGLYTPGLEPARQDKDDTGTVSGEDDLFEISLAYEPSTLQPGSLELKIPYEDDEIKVWGKPEKAKEWRAKLPQMEAVEQ